MKPYPYQVCAQCGEKAQKNKRKMFSVSTYNIGVCEVCGKERPVTEARDFGYPRFKGHSLPSVTKGYANADGFVVW